MQERHQMDILSLVFGLLFAALAFPVLVTDTPLDFEAGWVVPAVIVAIDVSPCIQCGAPGRGAPAARSILRAGAAQRAVGRMPR